MLCQASDGIVHPLPSFPRRRESRPVGTETYRIKRFLQPYALDSRFCGNDEVSDGIKCFVRLQTASSTLCRPSRAGGNPDLSARKLIG
ncbi:hypothetical protein ACTMOW_06205 [Neisseria meningitidis]|uniref:hypothetical protein n=1 Tax=Neisseria meningitidis TaxID=487 RepID=UPI000C31EEA1|nr:hypothetical protein [Neisseria meningitidis]